ncbi:MAG: hypothetical protein RMI01_08390, partial [Thermodesulfovibrio sp.]|nr:hypothetical protein [Thermodesulfovibrio sp.]
METKKDRQPDYYVVSKNNRQAIFHKSGKQISNWFDSVHPKGLLKNQSDYYVAENKNQCAIFHKSGRQVSNWHFHIFSEGLVQGQSEYYIASNEIDVKGAK